MTTTLVVASTAFMYNCSFTLLIWPRLDRCSRKTALLSTEEVRFPTLLRMDADLRMAASPGE
jgi:hypothetical protein